MLTVVSVALMPSSIGCGICVSVSWNTFFYGYSKKKIKLFLLKTILKLPLIANIHKKFTLKSPEMRFVFQIILNLQKIQNKQKNEF